MNNTIYSELIRLMFKLHCQNLSKQIPPINISVSLLVSSLIITINLDCIHLLNPNMRFYHHSMSLLKFHEQYY